MSKIEGSVNMSNYIQAEEEFKAGLAKRLKELELGYENRDAAVSAYGVGKNGYENWVYAQAKPSLEAIAKIAQVAGVSLDWLAFGEGESPAKDQERLAGLRELIQPLQGIDPWAAYELLEGEKEKMIYLLGQLSAVRGFLNFDLGGKE